FIEQPRVLDGDDSLVGKVLDQFDLLVAERTYLLAIQADGADDLILFEHGNESQREYAGNFNCANRQWMAVELRLILSEISYLHRLAGLSNAAHRGCSAVRPVSDPRANGPGFCF